MYYTEQKIHKKMRSPTRYNNKQTTSCPCLKQQNRRNRIQRLTTSDNQPCVDIKRRNKSRIQTISYSSMCYRGVGYKRFLILCSCLYLISTTQLSVLGNSSSPAEERKYLRSSRGEEGTIDNNSLTHHTDDMILNEEEDEEEEEFDYEKFHARHHIPLPALGALGSSSYEQQGDISNNNVKDIAEEGESLLMDESYMVPEVRQQAAAVPQEVQKNEPPPMGQKVDSPDSRIDILNNDNNPQSGGSFIIDTTSDARRKLTVSLVDGEDSILIDESFMASTESSTTSEVTSHDARRRLTVPLDEEKTVDTILKSQEQVVLPNIKEEEQELIHEKDRVISNFQEEFQRDKERVATLEEEELHKANLNEEKIHEKDRVISNFQEEFQRDKERIATLEEKELHEGELNDEKLQKKYQEISTLHEQVAQDQLKLQLLKERVKHHQEVEGEEHIRFLPPVTEPSLADDEEEGDEEFDYESYHTKHHIPLPALGVSTMMGLMQNTGEVTRDATLDEEIAHLNDEKQHDRAVFSTLLPRLIDDSVEREIELKHEDMEINELRKKEQQDKARLSELLAKVGKMGGVGSLELQEDDAKISELRKEKEDDKSKYMALLAKLEENAPKGLLAFAGTNLAMKNFASYGIIDEGDDDIMDGISTSSSSSNIPIMYENTLASISKYRSSLLESNELAEDDIDDNSSSIYDTSTNELLPKEDADSSTDKQTDIESVLADSTSELESPAMEVNFTSTTSAALSDQSQSTYSNLDRGRHLVGLEVREVQPHQQIIIDYQDIVSDYDYDEHEPSIRPLRIRFLLPDHDDGVDYLKNSKILSQFLDNSFNQTATFWAQALSLPPVIDNVIPTVPSCGGANIPQLHRETGVDNADIIVYVSGDNTFCGGSIMHSSICDFDQFMRPLVANINICTNNIPGVSLSSSAAVETDDIQQAIPTNVLADYNEYILTETSRILGASTSLFQHYHNPDTDTSYGTTETYANCIDGSQESVSLPNIISEDVDTSTGNVYYELRTPRVIEVVRNNFNCMTLTGARMEVKKGGTSCFGGFLDDVSTTCYSSLFWIVSLLFARYFI